jgi:hypothetical protein
MRLAASWPPDRIHNGKLTCQRTIQPGSRFEAGARTAREAVDRGAGYASIADGIREFNAKLLDIAQANTMAGMNFVFEFTRVNGRTEAF